MIKVTKIINAILIGPIIIFSADLKFDAKNNNTSPSPTAKIEISNAQNPEINAVKKLVFLKIL